MKTKHIITNVSKLLALALIAGLFAHMMLGRRGTWGFVKDRLGRIAGPLFGLWWVMLLLQRRRRG